MLDKNQAMLLLKENLNQTNLITHSLAVALVMEKLAEHFHENTEEWYIAGLLHDIDYDQTYDNPKKHGLIAMDILSKYDLPQYLYDAIRRHSGNEELQSLTDKALWCADPVTGLVIASALMNPDKKIASVNLSSLKKKYKNKKFAAGASREQIASCENIGISLEQFLELSINAMKEIDLDL